MVYCSIDSVIELAVRRSSLAELKLLLLIVVGFEFLSLAPSTKYFFSLDDLLVIPYVFFFFSGTVSLTAFSQSNTKTVLIETRITSVLLKVRNYGTKTPESATV